MNRPASDSVANEEAALTSPTLSAGRKKFNSIRSSLSYSASSTNVLSPTTRQGASDSISEEVTVVSPQLGGSMGRKKYSNVRGGGRRLSMDDSFPGPAPAEFAVDNPILSPLTSLASTTSTATATANNNASSSSSSGFVDEGDRDMPLEPILINSSGSGNTPLHKRVSSQAQLLRPSNSPLHRPSSDYEKRQSLSTYMKANSFIEKHRLALSKKSMGDDSTADYDFGGFSLDSEDEFNDNASDFSDFYDVARPLTNNNNASGSGFGGGGANNSSTASMTATSRTRVSSSVISESVEEAPLAAIVSAALDDSNSRGGVRTFYLHARLFLPDNHQTLVLSAQLWNEQGDRVGLRKIELRNLHPEPVPTPGAGAAQGESHPFHYVGEVQLELPVRIGYIQLRRLSKKQLSLKRAPPVDVFIKDTYLKPSRDPQPHVDVMAFSRFQAYIQHGMDVVLRNQLSDVTISPHALATIRAHELNKNHQLQDRGLPDLEWAKTDGKPKGKGLLLTTHEKLQQFESFFLELPNAATHERPAVFNNTLRVAFDPTSYNGVPGYVDFPPKNQAFSWAKFSEFFEHVQATDALECAKRMSNGGKSMCYVDFSAFLETKTPPQHHGREVQDMRRIVKYFDLDEEFGRQYLEGCYVAHLQQYRSQEDSIALGLRRQSVNPTPAAAAGGASPSMRRPSTQSPAASSRQSRTFTASSVSPGTRQETKPSPAWVRELAVEAGADMLRPLFFADYASLINIPRNKQQGGYYAPARLVLQLDAQTNKLMPLGISLYYDEVSGSMPAGSGTGGSVWRTHLPKQLSWKVAKLFAKCAAGQEHQMINHALQTHLCVEPFVVSLERKVPLHHILYRVLKPHFRYTLDLNFKAKTLLLNENGRFDYIGSISGPDAGHLHYIIHHFKEWTFSRMCFPEDFKRRGFDLDPSEADFPLPGYLYAKDAMALWRMIESYITGVVFEHYQSEEQLELDDVVGNYFYEVHREGFPGSSSFHPTSRDELVRVLSGVIFTATVQHSAVNFPQFVQYAFIANNPLLMSKPTPLPNEPCSVDHYLPNDQQALKAMRTTWGLSRFTLTDERFMWSEDRHFFNLSLFNDKRYRALCDKFMQRADNLERHILRRPASVYGTRYLWLLPSTTPTSITT